MYKFIWEGKPDKIKRETLIKEYDKGGLKMLESRTFIKSLKITWVKRIVETAETGNVSQWISFFLSTGRSFWYSFDGDVFGGFSPWYQNFVGMASFFNWGLSLLMLHECANSGCFSKASNSKCSPHTTDPVAGSHFFLSKPTVTYFRRHLSTHTSYLCLSFSLFKICES